jgi:hypothetical protein
MLALLGDAWDELYRDNEDEEEEEDNPLHMIVDDDIQAFRERVKKIALESHGVQY